MGPPRRPPARPLNGANAVPVNAPPPRPTAQVPVNNGRGPENVNQVNVGENGPNRRDEYQEAHQTYVVFVTEATDKRRL